MPNPNTWTYTGGNMSCSYVNHTATLLPNGQVLVAGGSGNSPKVAQLYDPTTDTWTPTGSLINAHIFDPTATLLPNGRVLLVGGGAQPELYDPNTGTWIPTAAMNISRNDHTATLLPNGQVLVAGGLVSGGAPSNSVEVYDPNANTWTSVGNMLGSRANHTATLIPNGPLVFLGGFQGTLDVATSELYDYINMQSFSGGQESHLLSTPNMSNHTATPLPNGIVAVGGTENPSLALFFNGAEWGITSSCPHDHSNHTATLLPNGQILIVGGGASGSETATVDIYDQSAPGNWNPGSVNPLNVPRTNHAAVLLSDGRCLVVGGTGSLQTGVVGALRLASAGNTAEYYVFQP